MSVEDGNDSSVITATTTTVATVVTSSALPASGSDVIMEYLTSIYRWAMDEKSDPRTSGWLLMSSPLPTLIIVLLYFIVIYGGQWVMTCKKQAFDLRRPIIAYNAFIVALSAYMFWELLATSVLQSRDHFDLVCEKVDYSTDNPAANRLAAVIWWYYFSKIIELCDTVFFMLRKKNNQITFLHVYHHSTMPVLWWLVTRFVAGGPAYFSPMINCLIHVLMYSYYLLAAAGPRFQKFLWWKKYMTSLQLVQFVFVLIHTTVSMVKGCEYPRGFQLLLFFYMLSMVALFRSFYKKTYSKRDDVSSKTNKPTSPSVFLPMSSDSPMRARKSHVKKDT